MASIKTKSVGRRDLYLIEPAKIQEKPDWNVRAQTEELNDHIEQLALSIAEVGVQQAITVYMEGDVIYLSDGHCRLAAVNLAIERGADIKSIPCRVEERYANDADRVLAMIVKNSGKPLTPLEKASVAKRLVAFGWSEGEIAKKTGISKQYVGQLLQMGSMPETLKGMVKEGVVSASVALGAQKEYGEGAVEKVAAAATQQPGETKKKRVTKKALEDRKPQIKKELKALAVIRKQAGLYSEEDFGKINDLCFDLEVIFTKEVKDV